MGITLTSKKVSSTYDALLKLSDNDQLTGAFKLITDGLGNDSGISINNSGDVNISGILVVGERVNTPILQLTGGSGTQGTMSWNANEETVDLVQNGTTTPLNQATELHVKNQTGATIAKGTPVRAAGTLGASGRILIAPMIANGTIEAKYFLGITNEAIANGEDGKVITFGKIRSINTAAYTEGQTLWVSATTAGAFTTTRPVAPNLDLEVAIVINSHVNNGVIFVRATNGHYIGTAHDVNISSVAENDLLVYKTNRWVNTKTIGDLTAANVTLSGYLRGPATFVIDPAAYGDETGLVQILGDLRVDGTTTTINSTTISVSDKNITLAKDAATAGDANGAGITIAGASATLTYLSATDDFTFNKAVNAAGFVGDLTGNADTADALSTARNIALDGSVTGNADFDGSGNITITTTTNHNHDDRYYTETEVGNFFSGTTAITGYNKTNWDAAYDDKINSGYFDSNTGDLVLTRQDDSTLEINFDDRYVIANTGNFKTNTYSVNSAAGTQRYLLMTGSQTDQFFHITINRAYDYGDSDQTKQQIIYQRRNSGKNLRWRLDGDIVASQQVFIEIYARANGEDDVWIVCTDFALPQVYVEYDGFSWYGLSTADTPTGTLIKTTELTASNKPNWDSQVGLVKTTELYSDTTYLRGSAFVLSPNNSSYDTLVYRDGTNPHVLYAGGGTSTQWNTAYGWGDHSLAGYLTSFDITTQTDPKYLRSDVSDTMSGTLIIDNSSALIVGDTSMGYGTNIGYMAGFKGTTQSIISIARADQTLATQGMLVGISSDGGFVYMRQEEALTLVTNSTNRVRILGNGRVGINTDSPDDLLHVKNGCLRVEDTSGNTLRIIGAGAGSAQIYATGANYGIKIESPTESASYYLANLTSGGSSKFYVRNDGNVGISTDSPSTKLDVNGVITATGGTSTNWNTAYSYSQVGHLPLTGGSLTGNLSLTSSTGTMSVYSNAGEFAAKVFAGWTGGTGISMSYLPNTAESFIDNNYVVTSGEVFGDINFRQNVAGTMTTRMMIKADGGNVGIGKTPSTKLDVNGGISGHEATIANTSPLYIANASSASYYGGLSIRENGTEKARFAANSVSGAYIYSPTWNGFEITSDASTYFKIHSSGVTLINQTSNLTSQQLQVHGFIDITASTSALRFYNGTTYKGGIGTADWAWGLSTNDLGIVAPNKLIMGAGAATMWMTTDFRVGIGTASPVSKLHVVGEGDTVTLQKSNNIPAIAFLGTSTNKSVIEGGDNFNFYTGGSSRVYITNGGNVGIGTTSPGRKLTVYDTSEITNGQLRLGYNDSYYWELGRDGTFNGRLMFVNKQDNTPSELFSILPNGNVGIGTTNPARKLTIESASTTWDSAPQVAFYDSVVTTDARNWTIGNVATDYGSFNIASSTVQGGAPTTSRLTINKDGLVGIGTTSPNAKLDVDGNIYIRPSGILATNTIDSYNTTLTIKSASTIAMYINSSQQVGIGTTSPAVKLDVAGRIRSYAPTGEIYSYSTNPAEWATIYAGWTAGTGMMMRYHPNTAEGYIENNYQATSGQVFGDINFRQNVGGTMTTRMTLKAQNGNFGIGTGGTADYRLDVSNGVGGWLARFNNSNGTETITTYISHGDGYGIAIDSTENDSKYIFKAMAGTGGGGGKGSVPIIYAQHNGYVGIGTDVPAARLEVKDGSGVNFRARNNGTNVLLLQNYNDTEGYRNLQIAAHKIDFLISATDGGGSASHKVGINQYGQLLINATSSAYSANYYGYNLGVRGNSSQAYISIARDTQTLDSEGLIVGLDTGAARFYLRDNLPIIFSNNNATKMTISTSGTVTATGDVLAYSDARVKENVETIDNALDKVMAMRGVSYNRTDTDDKSKKVGVIAQEIQKVLPEVVQEQTDGMLGVSYGNIVGVLIEAIKDQQKQIDELKALLNGITK